MRRALIIDTSILCCLLSVPGKETCGRDCDRWDHARVEEVIRQETARGTTVIVPLATIVETGNHIAQGGNRYQLACDLVQLVRRALDNELPWAADVSFDEHQLRTVCAEWPDLAAQELAMGDAMIKTMADRYARAGVDVVILTGDAGLKAFEPTTAITAPRRRQ